MTKTSSRRALLAALVLAASCGRAQARYIESDPIGLAGGLNNYVYALANPLKYIDPRGTDSGFSNIMGGLPNISSAPADMIPVITQNPSLLTPYPTPNYSAALPRAPDYVTVSVSYFSGWGGPGGSYTMDVYGQQYVSVAAGTAGYPSARGMSLVVGYMDGSGRPSPQCISNFLGGWSNSVFGGYVVGVGQTWNNAGNATTFGLTTPGAGAQRSPTFPLPATLLPPPPQ